jgi:hypothetical protein
MNVTLSIDPRLLARARKKAEALGKSVNQLVREYLERLVGERDIESELEEFRRLSEKPAGDSRGRRWTRDELHERS